MTDTETDAEQIPTGGKALVFLTALLDSSADELGRINSAIRAAAGGGERLHPGAGLVIAEGITNPEIARMLEQLEQKRRKPRTAPTGLKGMTRQQISAEATERREQYRQQREQSRQKRAQIRAAKLAEQEERKRQREQIRAARRRGEDIHITGENGTAEPGAHGDAIRNTPRREKDGEKIHIHT